MATPDPSAPPVTAKPAEREPDDARRRRRGVGRMELGSLPHYLMALAIIAAMAWYFFVFVPTRIEYFQGVRLRALSVAGNQLQARANNLHEAFGFASAACRAAAGSAPPEKRVEFIKDYVSRLLPGVRVAEGGAALPPGLRLSAPACTAPNDPTAASPLEAVIPWHHLIASAEGSIREGFDDVVLALPTGEVVWQREDATPRIGNLGQVLHAVAPERGLFSTAWNSPDELPKADPPALPTAPARRRVNLNGADVFLLIQPVTIGSASLGPLLVSLPAPSSTTSGGAPPQRERTVLLGAFVPRAALLEEAMRLPFALVSLLAVPVLLLFLALPFVKLATLRARERFAFVDALALLTVTILLAMIAAVLPFIEDPVSAELDESLALMARSLDEGLRKDTAAALTLLQTLEAQRASIATHLRPCSGEPLLKKCGLWEAVMQNGVKVTRALDLDVVIWLDAAGAQVDKWTTKVHRTHLISHARFGHFRQMVAGETLHLPDPTTPFTLEPLRAPTTGELGLVLVRKRQTPATTGDSASYLAMNMRMPSVLDVVVPRGYGFAIIDMSGAVLLHSEEDRSLHENLLQELADPATARQHLRSEHTVTWGDDYYGRPHRLRMSTLTGVQGAPWRLLTFKDLSGAHAAIVAQQASTFRLALVSILLLAMIGIGTIVYARARHRDPGDLLNVGPVVRPERLLALVSLVVVGIGVVLLIAVPAARGWLDWIYAICALLPLLAIPASTWARKGEKPPAGEGNKARSAPSGWRGRLLSLELGLLIAALAVLPAAGFARIASRLQHIDAATASLEDVQRQVSARAARFTSRIHAPAFAEGGGTRAFLQGTIFGSANARSRDPLLVQPVADQSRCAPEGGSPAAGQQRLRAVLGWSLLPADQDEGGPYAVVADGDRLVSCVGSSQLAIAESRLGVLAPWALAVQAASLAGSVLWPARQSLALLVIVATLGAAYWARRKLMVFDPVVMPTFSQILGMHAPSSTGIMLIGAPRTRKDAIVTAAVAPRGGLSIPRLRLLEEEVTAATAQRAFDQLRMVDQLDLPKEECLWIHVSNLETHLMDRAHRQAAFTLLERLFDSRIKARRVVIVTSSVDPIAHFDEIFDDERRGIYKNALPELDLNRTALLLTLFRRCYEPACEGPDKVDPWWNFKEQDWPKALAWETRPSPLVPVARELELAWKGRPAVSRSELLNAMLTHCQAYYQLLWTGCTRREKLVLIQLAQEGFVTNHNADVIAALLGKGLIMLCPGPQLFNQSFRVFLRGIERREIVQEWERQDGDGVWVVIGRVVAGTVVAGGVFVLLTQGYSMQALLPVVSGSGVFGIPIIRNALASLSGKAAGQAGAAA